MNRQIFIFCISFFFIFSSQSQTMRKTSLEIPEMYCWILMKINANASTIKLLDEDNDNYYFHLIETQYKAMNVFDVHTLVSINKDLTTIQRMPIYTDEDQSFLEILSNKNEIIVFSKKFDDGLLSFVKKTFSKSDLKLLNESTIVTFEHGKFNPSKFYTVKSPDKTKVGLMALISSINIQKIVYGNPDVKIGSYCVAVIDQTGSLVWKKMKDLSLANESFKVDDIVLTNDAQMYILFNFHPENSEKTTNIRPYLDFVFLDKNNEKTSTFSFENQLHNTKLHVLKNGDLFIAGVYSDYSQQTYFNKILSKNDWSEISEDSEKLSFKQNSYFDAHHSPQTFGFFAEVKTISELEDGTISVLCEQIIDISYLYGLKVVRDRKSVV